MALITRSTTASIDMVTARNAPQISGLYAGEALDVCAPCYIKSSDGKVYMCNATADNEAAEFAGFTPRAVAADEPVTLYGLGTRMKYGSSLTPGNILYLGATAGRLDSDMTTGDRLGIAIVVTATDIMAIRQHPNWPAEVVALADMADLAQGSLIVGGASDRPTALDASTDAQILVGDGTDLKSVAVSGDATLANTGALTIAALAVTAAKAKVFFSTEQTGNANPQNVAHGLGVVPAGVLVIPSDCPDSAWALAQGAHDATNVVVTATNLLKYYVFAWA